MLLLALCCFKFSAVVLHGVGEILHALKLVAGNIACGSQQQGGDAVYDGGAGVLNGGGLFNGKLHIGLAEDLQSHISPSSGP